MLGYFWGSKPKSTPDEQPSKEQQEKINWVEETKKIGEEETRKKLEEQERQRKIEERRLKLIEDGIEEWELDEDEENQDDQTISEGQNSSDSESYESQSQNLSASARLADLLNDLKDLQDLNATETSPTLVINHLRENVSTEAIGEVDESRSSLRHSSIDCDDTNPYLENMDKMLCSTDLLVEDFMRLSAIDEGELIVPPKLEPKELPPTPIPDMPQDLNASWFPFWRNNAPNTTNQASTEIQDIKKQLDELKALVNAGVQPTGADSPPPAPGGPPPPPSPGGPPPPAPGNGPPPPGNGPPPPGSGPPGPGKPVVAVKKVEEKVVEPNEVVLTRLVGQSDGFSEAMKKQGVEIYLKYFSNKPKGMVALLNDYPYLVTQYPIDPDKTLKIMGWWEKWVWKEISELMKDDPKGLATLKKNKLIEIQKTENEEQVKEECVKMKQVIKQRQDDLLMQQKMKGKHIDFSEVVLEIQSRGKAKERVALQEQEAEQKRMLEEKMKLLNACAADDIDDDMFS